MFEKMKNGEMGYALVANAILVFPSLGNALTKLYQNNKYRCYALAKNYRFYDDVYITSGHLQTEVKLKRYIGILLLAEEDEGIRLQVIKALKSTFPDLFQAIKKADETAVSQFIQKGLELEQKTGNYGYGDAYFVIAFYAFCLMDNRNEPAKFPAQLNDLFQRAIDIHITFSSEKESSDKRESVRYSSFAPIVGSMKELQSQIPSVLKISRLYDIFVKGRKDSDPGLEDYLQCRRSQTPIDDALRKTIALYCLFGDTMDRNELSIVLLFNKTYNKSYRDKINNSVRFALSNIGIKDAESSEDYFFWYAIGLFAQNVADIIQDCKKFYFANNDETQFLEVDTLTHQVEYLKEENQQLKQILDITQANAKETETKVRKEVKEQISLLEEQVRIQNRQINELKTLLAQSQEKDQELAKLREYVFESNMDYVPESQTASSNAILDEKNIIIIGGHENWRKKIVSEHPNLKVFSGTTKSLDVSVIEGADAVFLVTANMAHSVYSKLIERLRKGDIPYGYLGRFNPDLAEQEMLDQLKKFN